MVLEVIGQTINGIGGDADNFTIFDDCSSTSTWTEVDSDGALSTTSGAIQLALTNPTGTQSESAYLSKNIKNKGAFLIQISGDALMDQGSAEFGTSTTVIDLMLTDGSSTLLLKSQQVGGIATAGGQQGDSRGGGMISAHLTFKGGKVEGRIWSTGSWHWRNDASSSDGASAHQLTSVDSSAISGWSNVYFMFKIRVTHTNSNTNGSSTAQVPWVMKLDNFQTNIFGDT